MRAASRILRALWMESIVSQQEVQEIIRDLQVKDQMQFYTVHPPGHLRRVKPLPAGAGDASASTDSLPQVIALPALVIVPLHGDVQQLL